MDSFQIGIATGMIIIVVLITYFIHSFRKFKRDLIDIIVEKIKSGE